MRSYDPNAEVVAQAAQGRGGGVTSVHCARRFEGRGPHSFFLQNRGCVKSLVEPIVPSTLTTHAHGVMLLLNTQVGEGQLGQHVGGQWEPTLQAVTSWS